MVYSKSRLIEKAFVSVYGKSSNVHLIVKSFAANCFSRNFYFRSTTIAMYQWGLESLVVLLHDPFHTVVPSSLLTGLMLMQQWGQAALTSVRPPLPHSWPWLKA